MIILKKVCEWVKNDDSPTLFAIIRLFLSAIDILVVFLTVRLFGRLAYKKSYLTGRWFEKIWSPGWRWAFNGMIRKLFTGHGRGVPLPIGAACDCGRDVEFSPNELSIFQGNSYFQTIDGKISLGKNVWIARGVCLITTNHDPEAPERHLPGYDIKIGDNCWIGANAVVMPGVELGPHTVVGANAVVTKSFPVGHCVLVGVPAKVLRDNAVDGS